MVAFARFDRFATLYIAQPLRSVGVRSEARHLPILMYHSVSETSEDGVAAYYRTVTRPDIFRRQMACLKHSGWKGVSLREGLKFLSANSDGDEKFVAITFDDGFEDFYAAAWPALEENQFSATMYLPTGFIGDSPKVFKDHRCMTWSHVRELHERGIEFGSHTVTHPKLWDLQWPQIAAELRDSKRTIEDALGVGVPSFAYPYAFPQKDRAFASRFRDELQAAGYQNCVTTAIGRVCANDDRFALKRLPANSCDDSELLRAKLEGAYDWLAVAQNAIKSMKTVVRG